MARSERKIASKSKGEKITTRKQIAHASQTSAQKTSYLKCCDLYTDGMFYQVSHVFEMPVVAHHVDMKV